MKVAALAMQTYRDSGYLIQWQPISQGLWGSLEKVINVQCQDSIFIILTAAPHLFVDDDFLKESSILRKAPDLLCPLGFIRERVGRLNVKREEPRLHTKSASSCFRVTFLRHLFSQSVQRRHPMVAPACAAPIVNHIFHRMVRQTWRKVNGVAEDQESENSIS